MGCAQSKGIVISLRSDLIETLSEPVKHQLKLSIKRDDPVLFQYTMKAHNISIQEKLNDEFDTNWTLLHFAAARNAAKIIETFLTSSLANGQLSFDVVNALDMSGDTPLQTAFNYNCFEAFEAILVYCSKYQHKVNLKANFTKCIPKDSAYMDLLNAYKSKTISLERESGGRIDAIKEESEYLTIINRGQIDQAFGEVENHSQDNHKFQDKDFWQSINEKDSKVSWKALDKIFANDIQVLTRGGFNPNAGSSSVNPNLDIIFNLINEYPSCLNKIFLNLERNKHGIFSLVLYHFGQPHVCLLDEYFPCEKGKETLLFQKPFDSEIWPMIIEKGLAKLYGSYTKIANLSVTELLETILGAPVKHLKVSDSSPDIFWMTLQDFEHDNCLTLIESKTQKGCYFVLAGIFSVNEKRIVKLRICTSKSKVNKGLPESFITEEFKAIVGFETKEDGYYLVDYDDFKEQFENIIVSYYNQNWRRTAILLKNLGTKAQTFDLEIKKESKIFLSFIQKNQNDSPHYPQHFVLIQKEGSIIQTIAEGDSNCKTGSNICYINDEGSLMLDPGRYLIQVKALAKSSKSISQGVLVAYSSTSVSLAPVHNKTILEDILLSLGCSNKLKEPCGPGCEFTSGWWSIYHWLYFENNSGTKWEIEIKFEGLSNLKLGKPFRHDSEFLNLIVEKGQKKVVYLEKKDPSKPSDFKLDMNHIFDDQK